mgnify:FL=1|tara:strand:- start:110 stop:295 length:186 start_codon:yes stop_codon:yes gene_type:complete
MSDKQKNNQLCPNCGSDNNAKSRKLSLVAGILIFFGIPIPSFKKEYHCFDCYSDFKNENET